MQKIYQKETQEKQLANLTCLSSSLLSLFLIPIIFIIADIKAIFESSCNKVE